MSTENEYYGKEAEPVTFTFRQKGELIVDVEDLRISDSTTPRLTTNLIHLHPCVFCSHKIESPVQLQGMQICDKCRIVLQKVISNEIMK